MSFQRTIVGAHIKIYINGIPYQESQSASWNIDYGEEPIYGIDSPFPQEIKTTRISVEGKIEGVRIMNSGGIQGYNARPGIRESVFGPYISLRVQDRRTGEDLIFIPFAKVKNESTQINTKGVVKTSFSFSGLQPLQPLDRV